MGLWGRCCELMPGQGRALYPPEETAPQGELWRLMAALAGRAGVLGGGSLGGGALRLPGLPPGFSGTPTAQSDRVSWTAAASGRAALLTAASALARGPPQAAAAAWSFGGPPCSSVSSPS